MRLVAIVRATALAGALFAAVTLPVACLSSDQIAEAEFMRAGKPLAGPDLVLANWQAWPASKRYDLWNTWQTYKSMPSMDPRRGAYYARLNQLKAEYNAFDQRRRPQPNPPQRPVQGPLIQQAPQQPPSCVELNGVRYCQPT